MFSELNVLGAIPSQSVWLEVVKVVTTVVVRPRDDPTYLALSLPSANLEI